MKLDFKKLSSFKLSSLLMHISAVLLAFIVVMAAMVGWVVYKEVKKFTGLTIDTNVAQSQTIRVNMEKYQELQKRLDENAEFEPQAIPKAYVFSTPPENRPAP